MDLLDWIIVLVIFPFSFIGMCTTIVWIDQKSNERRSRRRR